MEFNLEKTEQLLIDSVRINDNARVHWVKSINGLRSIDLHDHFEVNLSDHARMGEPYLITSLKVPNYEVAVALLRKLGTITETLEGYLRTSFPEKRNQFLNIYNFHINWGKDQD